jgi:hypothetical protein
MWASLLYALMSSDDDNGLTLTQLYSATNIGAIFVRQMLKTLYRRCAPSKRIITVVKQKNDNVDDRIVLNDNIRSLPRWFRLPSIELDPIDRSSR